MKRPVRTTTNDRILRERRSFSVSLPARDPDKVKAAVAATDMTNPATFAAIEGP